MSLTPVEFRHVLHMNPELANSEFKTTEFIIETVKSLVCETGEPVRIHRLSKTGVVVEKTVHHGPHLLFRADIDALNIKEKTEAEFTSKNNYMHACGHDIHAAILYGFLKSIMCHKINQNLLFAFQPAEETGEGAQKILKSHFIKNFEIKHAFALHVTDDFPIHSIASKSSTLFASAMEVDIEFIGEAAHVAFPEKGKNAFNALRFFLDLLDETLEKMSDTIIGIGKVEAGKVRNIQPDLARIYASIRTPTYKQTEKVFNKISRLCKKVSKLKKLDYNIKKGAFLPEVKNDKKLYRTMKRLLSKKFKFIECNLKMVGEDFGFFTQSYPSFMFWLGSFENKKSGLHNPEFLPSDKVIDTGIDIFNTILIHFI